MRRRTRKSLIHKEPVELPVSIRAPAHPFATGPRIIYEVFADAPQGSQTVQGEPPGAPAARIKPPCKLARPEGLEPPTLGLEGRPRPHCLSYGRAAIQRAAHYSVRPSRVRRDHLYSQRVLVPSQVGVRQKFLSKASTPKVVKGVSPGIGVKARTLRSLALIITIFSISTAGTEVAGAFFSYDRLIEIGSGKVVAGHRTRRMGMHGGRPHVAAPIAVAPLMASIQLARKS